MIYKDIVKEMDNSVLKDLITNGLSQKDIAKEIQNSFRCFFKNNEKLVRYSNDLLIHDFINYYRNYYDEINDNIEKVLKLFYSAQKTNKDDTYKYCAVLQKDLVEVSNKQWSYVILQKDFSSLDIYEYVVEAFNLIENICENSLKVYLKFLLIFFRITKNKNISIEAVNKLKFGTIVNELVQCPFLDDILKIKEYEVSLSQWRNIACHKDYKIVCGKIECKYGSESYNIVCIESKEKLLEIVKEIYRMLQTINFASKFFLYDNIDLIKPFYDLYSDGETADSRAENWHLPFVTELYVNGFKVVSIEKDTPTLKISVTDFNTSETKISAIKSTIILYKAWFYSSYEKIQISYLDSELNTLLTVETSADICKLISENKKDISFLAEKMQIIYCDNVLKN